MSRIFKKVELGGVLVGVAVDLLVMLLIPGSSIIEGVLGFIAGVSAGISYMVSRRTHTVEYA